MAIHGLKFNKEVDSGKELDPHMRAHYESFLRRAVRYYSGEIPIDKFESMDPKDMAAIFIRNKYPSLNESYFRNYIFEEKVPDMFMMKHRSRFEKLLYLEYIRNPFRQFYLFLRRHIFSTSFSPRCLDDEETIRFHSKSSRSHINSYKFFTYQIPSNYVNYILSHKFNSLIIFDKIFSLLLISKLKILSNFQKLDNIFNLDINFNFFKIFSYKTKINDINLIKKKSFINFKLYKNNLIEEAGFYNINILENGRLDLKDEDFFLLYNRKRLDNESIYKSWHSTKFLNKKINYYSNSSVFNLEKNFEFFYNSYIFLVQILILIEMSFIQYLVVFLQEI